MDPESSSETARRLLIEGLEALRLEIAPTQVEALLGLAVLLSKWSVRMNLTGHRSLTEIVQRMILETVALAQQIPPIASLADIGSGAGFPGLPIAILRPSTEVSLIEPRRKRHHFQRAVVRELGITNATPLHGRAEELTPQTHTAVIAQALAPPERALSWMLPWVEPGGWILLPGSEERADVSERPGVAFEAAVSYGAPNGGPRRSLWIGRRT